MKYRLLVLGNNKAAIDDMFSSTKDSFEFQTTSDRIDDIVCHFKYFQPHATIFYMDNESVETITQLSISRYGDWQQIPLIVIGTPQSCEQFRKTTESSPDLELLQPIAMQQIKENIIHFLKCSGISMEEDDYTMGLIDTQDAAFAATGYQSQAPVQSAAQGTPPQKRRSWRKHILVVDDDARMLRLIKRYLDDDYDIATASSGKAALKFLEKKMTDLILLDYTMPFENGYEIFEKLRNNKMTKDIPVIFMTGLKDRVKIQQVLALQPNGYMLKPIDYKRLINTIRDALR